MAKTPEAKVKDKIKKTVSDYGLYTPTFQAGYGKNGTSDSLNCIVGFFVAVEAKATANDHPTALQQIYLAKVVAADGFGFVVDAQNLDVFEQFCNALREEKYRRGRTVRYAVDEDWRLKWVEIVPSSFVSRRLVGDTPTLKKKSSP